MRLLLAAAALLAVSPAFADGAPPTPMEQTLGTRLIQELNASVACGAALIADQQQLAAALARVKALEEKYEPKVGDAK